MPEIRRSATEARLLALLSSMPGQEAHTRDLMRRIGGSPRPVQLALEKLERQGLIESRRVGNLRLWRMDPSHPLYRSLRELYARTVGVAARIAEAFRERRGVEIAFIFGSYARGDDDVRSDVDVFVLGDPEWRTLDELSRKLFDELRREVNFVTYQESDLRRAVEARSHFIETLRQSEKIWIVGDQDEFERRITSLDGQVRRRRPAAQRRPRGSGDEARARRAEPRARSSRKRRPRS